MKDPVGVTVKPVHAYIPLILKYLINSVCCREMFVALKVDI